VLVAHSYAGAPATIAATQITDRIRRIVYVAAVLPAPGKTLFEITPPGVEDLIRQTVDAEGDGCRIPVMRDDIIDAAFGNHGLSRLRPPPDPAPARRLAMGGVV
jgi:hypothetical protein